MAAGRGEGQFQLGMLVNFDLPAGLLTSRVSRVQNRNLRGVRAQGVNPPQLGRVAFKVPLFFVFFLQTHFCMRATIYTTVVVNVIVILMLCDHHESMKMSQDAFNKYNKAKPEVQSRTQELL